MTIGNLLKRTKAFLFDLDGTLYLGDRPIEGAVETLCFLRQAGKRIVFLTNNSSKTAQEYEEKLSEMHLFSDGDVVYTSGQATVLYLKEHFPEKKVFLLAPEKVCREFACAGVHLSEEDPDVAVLAYDTELTYAKIEKLDALLRRGIVYLATHSDDVCPTENSFKPDVGCFLKLFERSTGRLPDRIIGKPNQDMAKGVLKLLGLEGKEVCMVGDRMYTDIRFANQNHLLSVLVLSGESNLLSLSKFPDKPDLVLPSVKDLHKSV